MAHDYGEFYGELMSLALDGRLTTQERVTLQSHLATCEECRAQWAAFQQVDLTLSSAAQVMPAPGFAARFAQRLARQSQVERIEVQRTLRRQVLAGIGVLATGAAAMALLVVSLLVTAWSGIDGLANLAKGSPSLLSQGFELTARWLVTLHALGETVFSVLNVLTSSGGPILAAYMLVLIVVAAVWVSVMRGAFKRWNRTTLPVLVWL
jgi:predicted anti-sigma-YlaC factor YlaD